MGRQNRATHDLRAGVPPGRLTRAQLIRIKKDIQEKPVEDLERSETVFHVARSRLNKGQKSHQGGGKNSLWNILESGITGVRAEPPSPRLWLIVSILVRDDHQSLKKRGKNALRPLFTEQRRFLAKVVKTEFSQAHPQVI